jgi:hypothetical protein
LPSIVVRFTFVHVVGTNVGIDVLSVFDVCSDMPPQPPPPVRRL